MSSSGGPQGPDGEGGTADRPEPGATRPPDGRGYDANQFGRARAMTVFSPVRPWYRPPGGVVSLRVAVPVGRAVAGGKTKIRQLSFIRFARGVIIHGFPDHGQPRDPVR